MFDSLKELGKRRAERKKKRELEDQSQKSQWLDSNNYIPPDTEEEEEYDRMLAQSMANRRKLRSGK